MHLPDAGRAVPSSEGCAAHPPSLLSLVAVRQTWRGVLLGHEDRASSRDGGESRLKGALPPHGAGPPYQSAHLHVLLGCEIVDVFNFIALCDF